MNSPMYRLHAVDFAKGLLIAALGAVAAAVAQAMSVPGFDLTTFDWNMLWQVGVTAGFAYLAKNLFSDSEGKFLGHIG